MSHAFPMPNPFWWLHYRLLGPRKLLAYGIVWSFLLVAGTFGFRYVDRDTPLTAFCDGVLYVVMIIQLVIIIGGACNSSHRALFRDADARMIESHRVSPISGFTVLTGYMLGPNLHVLIVYALNTIFGLIVIRWGTFGAEKWLLGNALVLVSAMLPLAATVLIGIGSPKPTSPIGILVVLLILSPVVVFVPGLGVFTGFYAVMSGALMMISETSIGANATVTLVLINSAIAMIWGRAAIRKYRRPDRPAFDTRRAFGLLIIWLLISAVALVAAKMASERRVTIFGERINSEMLSVSLAATIGMTFFVSFLPIGALAHYRVAEFYRQPFRSRGTVLGMAIAPVLCSVLALSLSLLHIWVVDFDAFVLALVALTASLASVEAITVRSLAIGTSPHRILGIFVFIFWLTPTVGDVSYREIVTISTYDFESFNQPTLIAAVSPVAHVLRLFEFNGASPIRTLIPGTVVQVLLAVVLAFAARRTLRQRESMG